MKIYNTLTRRKEEFVPLVPGEARIYACGPTVYNFIHIGNARPLITFDALRRYLEYRGMKVTFVQNFTDVDDKMIRRAHSEHSTVQEIAEKYIAEYYTDARGLNVRAATVHPRATENMQEILSLVGTLVEKGFAYVSHGDVYFRTQRFQGYGKLSHQPLEDLEAGARVDIDDSKEDPMDFALWKAEKPGEPAWDSPWGRGRPGWHIECSAMARRYLGETIDIHGGGQDLIFPHHENEIAQSECANGVPFARYWMHNGYVNIDNHKMSKSLNNFFTVRDVAQEYGYEPIRFLMLSAQYRNPINYSLEILEQSKAALGRLYNCRDSLDFALHNAPETAREGDDVFVGGLSAHRARFIEAMDDDLNTADALSAVFELVREANLRVNAEGGISRRAAEAAAALLAELCGVLGLLTGKKEESLGREVEELIEQRQQARKRRDFKTADAIRDALREKGVILEDSPQGVKWSLAEKK